jgi:hypothetical protein
MDRPLWRQCPERLVTATVIVSVVKDGKTGTAYEWVFNGSSITDERGTGIRDTSAGPRQIRVESFYVSGVVGLVLVRCTE